MKFIFLVGLFVISLLFQSNGNDFTYLRTSEGLYDGEINSIAQDSTGNMWFATWSGLIRYDGYSFRLFRPEIGDSTSLPDKKIKKLYVDSHDNLWIATSGKLSIYNKIYKTFSTIKFQNEKINILQLNELDGNLIVHAGSGFYIIPVNKARDKSYVAKQIPVYSNNQITQHNFSHSVSVEGKIILVTNNHNSISKIHFATIDKEGEHMVLRIDRTVESKEYINDMEYVPFEECLYIATTNGLKLYSFAAKKYLDEKYYTGRDLQSLIYTSTNQLFCSVKGPELLCLNLHTGISSGYISDPNERGSLLSNNILSLFEDFSGNLWIGHQGQGISIMNLYAKKFYSFRRDPLKESTLNSNTIMSFEGTERNIFIGCRSGGLNIISKNDLLEKNPVFNTISIKEKGAPDLLDDGIWDIEKQSDSLFWLGTGLGLFKLIKKENDWAIEPFRGKPEISGLIRKVFIDDNNNIWCGTYDKGLIFISNIEFNEEGINYSFPSVAGDNKTLTDNLVHDIFLDSRNRFWVATVNGLNLLDEKYSNLDLSGKQKPVLEFKQYVAHELTDDFLNNNEINNIFENFDGKIWLATQGGGINILDPESGDFNYLTKSDGLPSNDVQGILADDEGKLWISTLEGLVAYSRFAEVPDFTVFDSSDGIHGENFMVNSSYKCPDGQMFFGSDNGFTAFYPNLIQVNEIKPKVAFSDFYFRSVRRKAGDTLSNGFVINQSINYSDKIVIPYYKNYFRIDVATLHFQEPLKNKYKYILENHMGGWSTKFNHEEAIEFGSLPHGKYTLKVKGISSDNVESADIKTLFIEIEPPWYKTWYMTSIFSILAISLVMGIIYIIVNRQRLIYQKKLNTIELENNESKMMFLTNIAHELRTPLSLVIAPIEDLMKNYPVDSLWKNHLQLIHRNSNYLLRLINQIIDFRKLNAGKLVLNEKHIDIVRLIKDVVLNFKGYDTNRNVNLYLQVPAEPIYVTVDEQKIEEVLYNLISNGFKHTFDNNSIIVSMDIVPQQANKNIDKTQIRISVLNEGKEISEGNRVKVFERFFKVDESTEGAGIGLSYSKSLVELHRGNISVESIPEKGVAFHVLLPFSEIDVDEQKLKESANSEPVFVKSIKASTTSIPEINFEDKPTILIVEDNKELREFLYSFFSRNYNSIIARDGVEALEIVEKQNLNLIISDIILPNMDGYELCRKIKNDMKTCHIPFVLLTAKNTDEQMIKGYDVGADGYIAKPFDIHLLSAQVRRLIKNRALIKEKYRTQNFMVEMQINSNSKDEQFVKNVRKILEDNISDPEFNVNRLSKQLSISSTQLYRRMKDLTGHSPVEFIRILKLQKAYSLLGNRDNTIKEVCFLTGFNNLSYFIKCFREHFGVTPASFRDHGLIDEERVAV